MLTIYGWCEWNYHMIHAHTTRDLVCKDTIYKRCGKDPVHIETKDIVIDFQRLGSTTRHLNY